MSQDRLARLVQRTDGYISQLETGSRGKRVNRDVVVAIAQALNAPLNELLTAAGFDPVEADEQRAEFMAVVARDPALRSDQKRILADLYGVFVGRMA